MLGGEGLLWQDGETFEVQGDESSCTGPNAAPTPCAPAPEGSTCWCSASGWIRR